MKKSIFLIIFTLLLCNLLYGGFDLIGDVEKYKATKTNSYLVYRNIVNDGFPYPLVGVFNIAFGSHYMPQIGFVNYNEENFGSLQLSFINYVGGSCSGLQAGFINSVDNNFHGIQTSFINNVEGAMNGIQLSFINNVDRDLKGVQASFINNVSGNMNGIQLSFINNVDVNTNGLQIGFINNADGSMNGLQLGFLNYTPKLTSAQFGFMNVVDEVANSGIPIGLVSIVKNDGYKAFSLSANEIVPTTVLSFRLGIEKFYTSFSAGYNDKEKVPMLGIGFGEISNFNKTWFVNSDIGSTNTPVKYIHLYNSLSVSAGYRLNNIFSITAGPSVTHQYCEKEEELIKPSFSLYQHKINDKNKFDVGFKVGVVAAW
jgi:hypothetical protein